MKAVVYKEPCQVAVENVDDPRIEAPGDAVVWITSAAICGSDLHMYEGRTGAQPGTVFGHENMGVVEEVGPGVTSVKVGDRVVLPFNIGCGFCFNCLRGFTSACLTVNAAAPHAAYGYADMGPFKGGQAQYLRVPYADFNALKLPGAPGDQWEDDFVTLADIWPTGHHGVELAGVREGETLADTPPQLGDIDVSRVIDRHIRRPLHVRPLPQEPAIGTKNLDAVSLTIGHEHAPVGGKREDMRPA